MRPNLRATTCANITTTALSKSVQLKNLPGYTTEHALREVISEYGEIRDMKLIGAGSVVMSAIVHFDNQHSAMAFVDEMEHRVSDHRSACHFFTTVQFCRSYWDGGAKCLFLALQKD